MAAKESTAKALVNAKQAQLDADRAAELACQAAGRIADVARRTEEAQLAELRRLEDERLEQDIGRTEQQRQRRRAASERRSAMWKYVGEGTLLGVPARDLTDEEYAEYSVAFLEREGVTLLSTGFYVKDEPKATSATSAASEGE